MGKQGGIVNEANDFYRAEERYWGKVASRVEDFGKDVEDFVKGLTEDGIDMRSSSRYFTHDLGTNASRLIAFIEEANERIEALRPEPGAEPKKPAAPNKRAPKR